MTFTSHARLAATRGPAAWLQALRPLGAGMVLPPALLGWAWAADHSDGGAGNWLGLVSAFAFALACQAFVVFVNDLGDESDDRANTTPTRLSGGSRVLVHGRLTRRDLRVGAWAVGVGLVVWSAVASALHLAHPLLTLVALACLAVGVGYSAAPFRLAARGLGPLLQGVGTGVLLPIAGTLVTSAEVNRPDAFALWSLGGLTLAGVAANLATSLPDVEADARTGKRTLAVRIGYRAAHGWSLVVCAASLAALATAAYLHQDSWIAPACVAALPTVLLLRSACRGTSPDAPAARADGVQDQLAAHAFAALALTAVAVFA